MNKQKIKNQNGFTLIELLVVIAIIGILASIVMVALQTARARSKTAKVQADLHQLKTAIDLLANDTGKWPNGCPPDTSANPEVMLDQAAAGLNAIPPVGIVEDPCEWTAEDVALWKGPYVSMPVIQDPWGTSYWFDADYVPLGSQSIVLLSYGPDKTNYTADDLYIVIK
jgi:prepilin-type N-terminal cleavage/methylation domain-containing protein